MRRIIPLLLLLLAPSLFAGEVIPFGKKFERQQKASEMNNVSWNERIRAGMFRSAEKISSVFHIQCDGVLAKLTVNESLGGIGDIRHADIFHLEVNPDLLRRLYLSQGIPIAAIVEVTKPHDIDVIVSNMFNYDAKLNYYEPAGPTNPTDEQLFNKPKGAPVVVEGVVKNIVIENRKGALNIKTPDGRVIHTELPYGMPEYYGEIDSGLEIGKGKNPQIGDVARFKGTVADGGIFISSVRSAYLIKPSDERMQSYRKLRDYNSLLLKGLEESISKSNYPEAAKFSAKLSKSEKTRAETQVHAGLLAQIPESDRPMNWADRYVADDLSKKLNVDFDEMTLKQFLDYVEAWAERRAPDDREFSEPQIDGGYFYRLLEDIKISKQVFNRLLIKQGESRLTLLEERSKAEIAYNHETDFHIGYNLERAWTYLATAYPTPDSIEYLLDTAKRVVKNESEGWLYGKKGRGMMIPFYMIRALEHVVYAVDDLKRIPAGAQTQLKNLLTQKLPDLIQLRATLLDLGKTLEETPEPKILIIGAPFLKKSEPKYSGNEYATQLKTLDEIIAMIQSNWPQPDAEGQSE
jgi:hypothetical protein